MFKRFKNKKILSAIVASMMLFTLFTPVSVNADTTKDKNKVIDLTEEKNINDSTNELGNKGDNMTLQILTTTDTHGRFSPYDYAINMPNESGSLTQIATKVNELRTKNPNTILVDAGDIIQDNSESLFINTSVNPMILAMNKIGYDTMTLGNHEFNYGIPALKHIMKQFNGTVLGGNVYEKDGTTRIAAPYTIIERNGVKVGIIGMVTPNIKKWDSANLKGYKITNSVDETKAAIKELKKQNINVIIAVDHMGITGEYDEPGSSAIEVLEECPEITAFVAAHFHVKIPGDYYYDHKAYSLNAKNNTVTATTKDGVVTEVSMSEYEKAKANGTVIIEAYKWAQTLGQINIDLTKNADGEYIVANKGTDIITKLYDMAPKNGTAVKANSELINTLKPFNKAAIDDANTQIGVLKDGNLTPPNEVKGIDQAKIQPTPMLSLINKVQMYYGEKVANHKIDVSSAAVFKNGQNILEGSIKKCDTANIYKFDNTLYVLKITGSQLKKYMEWSVSYYNKYNAGDLTVSFNPNIPGYNFDMFAGIKYNVDISKDVGNRIVNLTRMDGSKINDSDEMYLTVNNYRGATQLLAPGVIFKNGEQLPVLVGKSEETQDLGDGRIRDLIGKYIQEVKGGTITPECDNNWSIIGNNWDSEQRKKAVECINSGKVSLSGISGEQTSNNSKSVTWDMVKNK
ncbi:5'-nucleotidase C-terminal domain-containing protein [Clostridium taeniosporum]|uniref:Bifunctional metallophosphatase/5'-nucleotidase n=1 Tax=Clostridium taeniosporum TaxID=394958 RepID=A0A1D7XFZ5_9CLOT|nr:5'-nucleotidase C-terminal domain-containing protein [Clostridium taeniosporum]AOR22276.1 bifunctional metallophosphatase/5'-nucleotidase [Clostridium taeniosporum]